MANANLANPFASCSMKLKRAHSHTEAFAREFKALDGTDFAAMYVNYNRASGDFDLKWGGSQPFIVDLQLTVADSLYNLRSALDQAACVCAELGGQAADGTYFPHGKDAAHFEKNLEKQCRRVPNISCRLFVNASHTVGQGIPNPCPARAKHRRQASPSYPARFRDARGAYRSTNRIDPRRSCHPSARALEQRSGRER